MLYSKIVSSDKTEDTGRINQSVDMILQAIGKLSINLTNSNKQVNGQIEILNKEIHAIKSEIEKLKK